MAWDDDDFGREPDLTRGEQRERRGSLFVFAGLIIVLLSVAELVFGSVFMSPLLVLAIIVVLLPIGILMATYGLAHVTRYFDR